MGVFLNNKANAMIQLFCLNPIATLYVYVATCALYEFPMSVFAEWFSFYNEIGKDEDKPGANFTCTKYTA